MLLSPLQSVVQPCNPQPDNEPVLTWLLGVPCLATCSVHNLGDRRLAFAVTCCILVQALPSSLHMAAGTVVAAGLCDAALGWPAA